MTEVLDVFGMSDQPTTCPKCGRRTEYDDRPDGTQLHTCTCGYVFVVDPDDSDNPCWAPGEHIPNPHHTLEECPYYEKED